MSLSDSARKIVDAAELLFASYGVAIDLTLLATSGALGWAGEAPAGPLWRPCGPRRMLSLRQSLTKLVEWSPMEENVSAALTQHGAES